LTEWPVFLQNASGNPMFVLSITTSGNKNTIVSLFYEYTKAEEESPTCKRPKVIWLS